MNRGAGQAHVEQIVIQEIGLGLRVDENQGTRGRHREKKVVEALLLQAILGVDDLREGIHVSTCSHSGLLGTLRSDQR